MAPSSAIQSRIQQFEALGPSRSNKTGDADFHPVRKPAMNYPPSPASIINPLEEPISPTASSFSTMKPGIPYVPRKPRSTSTSPSPPNLGLKTSLIDLKEWVMDDEPTSKRPGMQNGSSTKTMNGNKVKHTPSITAPPLPPRQTSKGSEKSAFATPKPTQYPPSQSSTSAYKPSRADSLTVEHTYPPLSKLSNAANGRQGQGHIHASSTSSFHSVSLSSDGGTDPGTPNSVSNFVATFPMDRDEFEDSDRDRDKDSVSVDDAFSFETVSSTAISSPSLSLTHEWEKDIYPKPEPPKLPERSRPRPSASPPSTSSLPGTPPLVPTIVQTTSRRAPPPPPLRARIPSHRTSLASTTSNSTSTSDRSSIFSTGTVATARTSIGSQLARPTPIPSIARKRYETVFATNIKVQRQSTKAMLSPNVVLVTNSAGKSPQTLSPRKGWRGLSVDLITNPDDHPLPLTSKKPEGEEEEDEGTNVKLNGQVVKLIWLKSKLDKRKLRDIWNECTTLGEDSIDREGFIKGMWRIDEELRRALSARESLTRTRFRSSKRTTGISLLH